MKSRAEPIDGAEAGLASRKRGGGGALTSGFCQSRSQPPSVASRTRAANESGDLHGRDEIGTAMFFAFSALRLSYARISTNLLDYCPRGRRRINVAGSIWARTDRGTEASY